MEITANRLNDFNSEEFIELKVIISSISLVITQTSSFHSNKDEWLKAFTVCKFDKLLKLAHFHGVIPWLAECFKEIDLPLNDELSERIEKITVQNKILYLQSQHQTNVAKQVSSILNKASIDHLSFKGTAVLEQFYKGYILTRVADDLDLLINTADLPKTTTLLINNGYIPRENVDINKVSNFIAHHEKSYRWRDIGFTTTKAPIHNIDLHWSLSDKFSLPTDTSQLIKNRIPINSSSALKTLPFTLHFVYLCVHGYSDYFFRLKNLVDLYAAMQQPQFDHDAINSCAKQYGVLQQVNESIQLIDSFFKKIPTSSNSILETKVFNNYSKNMGWTTRAHPNKNSWTTKDKRQHLQRQIKHRSRRSFWFSPIWARSKFNIDDADEWNGESLFLYRLKRILKKLTR